MDTLLPTSIEAFIIDPAIPESVRMIARSYHRQHPQDYGREPVTFVSIPPEVVGPGESPIVSEVLPQVYSGRPDLEGVDALTLVRPTPAEVSASEYGFDG